MTAYITELDNNNFKEFTSNGLVLIDIWAIWCGPCRMISPLIDELSGEYVGRLNVGKLDADANRDIVSELGVRNIPTILLYKDGELVKDDNGNIERLVGAISKQKIVEFIEKHI